MERWMSVKRIIRFRDGYVADFFCRKSRKELINAPEANSKATGLE
jgi:hypothetical protein